MTTKEKVKQALEILDSVETGDLESSDGNTAGQQYFEEARSFLEALFDWLE